MCSFIYFFNRKNYLQLKQDFSPLEVVSLNIPNMILVLIFLLAYSILYNSTLLTLLVSTS